MRFRGVNTQTQTKELRTNRRFSSIKVQYYGRNETSYIESLHSCLWA